MSNERCTCLTSRFFPHRKSKCALGLGNVPSPPPTTSSESQSNGNDEATAIVVETTATVVDTVPVVDATVVLEVSTTEAPALSSTETKCNGKEILINQALDVLLQREAVTSGELDSQPQEEIENAPFQEAEQLNITEATLQERCDCITSSMFPHRRIKCGSRNILQVGAAVVAAGLCVGLGVAVGRETAKQTARQEMEKYRAMSEAEKNAEMEALENRSRDNMQREINATKKIFEDQIRIFGLPWMTSPTQNSGCSIYTIPTGAYIEACKETEAYNFAYGQFSRLIDPRFNLVVTQIDAIEYAESSPVRANFESTKRIFLSQGKDLEYFVFHGTSANNISSIVENGFAVGGATAEVGIANGAVFGNGIYSATGPSTPVLYASDCNCIILARALGGNQKFLLAPDDECDSWIPKWDWMVFKSGAQILPCYVVHYTSPDDNIV